MLGKSIEDVFPSHEHNFYHKLLEKSKYGTTSLYISENYQLHKLVLQPIREDHVLYGFIISRYPVDTQSSTEIKKTIHQWVPNPKDE
jgi:hypothetical protein